MQFMNSMKASWIRKRWILGAGILLCLCVLLVISRQQTLRSPDFNVNTTFPHRIPLSERPLLFTSRQRTRVSPNETVNTAFPHRIPFSERAEFYTAGDREVIHIVENMLRSQADTGQEFTISTKNMALTSLSSIVQKQLVKGVGVNSANCSGLTTLLCGHHNKCGLGCQVRHRMTCVALAYVMGFPLIHNEVKGWGYRKKWKAAFHPIGSTCSVGLNTISVNWTAKGPRLTIPPKCSSCNPEIVPSSLHGFLEEGFIVPQEIGELVEKLHVKPFLWWAGQFSSFTLRLTQKQARILNASKASIGLNNTIHPMFGLHVRRTDKMKENKNYNHSIHLYFSKIEEFIRENNFLKNGSNQIIFIASDESTILGEAKKAYPTRRIRGFSSKKTLHVQKKRANALDDIIRDLFVLAESDYIVCGFSSNRVRKQFRMVAHPFLQSAPE